MGSSQQNDWEELAIRTGDGLEISLLWSKSAERVKVTVHDQRVGVSFDLDVRAADALSAFYHPFAYVTGRGRFLEGAVPASLDLQPHN